jgi:steroid delta-isomerase-like uncharacterized protein
MSEQDNVKVAHAQMHAFNAGEQDKWTQARSADYRAEGPGAPGPLDAAQNWMFLGVFRTAFPDLYLEVTRTLAQGDDVVVHWTATGTHTGPLRTPTGNSVPATGRKAVVVGSTTYEFKAGKIAHEWAFWDMTSLLGQLGLMPPM